MELLTKQLEMQICCLMELREERNWDGDEVEVTGLMRSSREDGLG